MQNRMRYSLLLLVMIVSLVHCQRAPSEQSPRKLFASGQPLSGEEIVRVFSGKTWDGSTYRGRLIRFYFGEDGTLIRVSTKGGYYDTTKRKLVGKWWARGNEHCIRFDKEQGDCRYCHLGLFEHKLDKDLCAHIIPDGQGGLKRVSLKGKTILHLKVVHDGNPYNLEK